MSLSVVAPSMPQVNVALPKKSKCEISRTLCFLEQSAESKYEDFPQNLSSSETMIQQIFANTTQKYIPSIKPCLSLFKKHIRRLHRKYRVVDEILVSRTQKVSALKATTIMGMIWQYLAEHALTETGKLKLEQQAVFETKEGTTFLIQGRKKRLFVLIITGSEPISKQKFSTVTSSWSILGHKNLVIKQCIPQEQSARSEEQIRNEYKILREINKKGPVPGIVRAPWSLVDMPNFVATIHKKRRMDLLVMLANRASLQINWTQALKMQACRDIACGLDFLHRNSILHGDLKPENVLVKMKDGQYSFIIADFGDVHSMSEYRNNNDVAKQRRTFTKASSFKTELISRKNSLKGKNFKRFEDLAKFGDVFSVGKICYAIFTFLYPYKIGKNGFLDLNSLIGEDHLANTDTPQHIRDIIIQMLNKKYKHRPLISKVCEIFHKSIV